MSILVTGSLALDHIMVFQDRFKNHILPDKIHMLNVAFHVPTLRRNFGGTAGNIAFSLRLLGEDPVLLATAGGDFDAYARWLERHGIRRDWIRIAADALTSQCFITTDLDDNQIIAFHPGAMDQARSESIDVVQGEVHAAIVAPTDKDAMLQHARALKARGVPTVIDPSHQLPVFSWEELRELIDGSDVYVANDYEWSLTCDRAGMNEDGLLALTKAIVVTRGAEGSTIVTRDRRIEIPPVHAAKVVDPTGCGDAFRAGLLYGMGHGLPFETGGRIGSLLGALTVEVQGPQGVSLSPDDIRKRFVSEFGQSLG